MFHEVVAREFARHLSDHPELRYTTAVRRGNPDLDPVEDFLDQTKAGHCERFASALVLMLRSQGIPSVLVLGFKGCEGVGGGRYVVRQEHAHVWAEALVARPAPRGFPANRVYHWLSLDPSPAELSDPPAPPAGLLGRVRSLGRETVGKYLTDYTPERRDEALRGTWAFARRPEVAGGAAAAVLLGLGVWAVRRRLARRVVVARPTGWYGDLLAVLAAHGYLPADGQTPREFAAAVAGELHADPATAPVAGLPPEWTARYYGERFGGRPAPAEFRTQAPGRLLLLAAALDSRRNRR